MIDLIVDAIGAPPRRKQALEKLAGQLIRTHASSLRALGRAPKHAAQIAQEREALLRRVIEAGRERPNYLAKKEEFSGKVDFNRRDQAPRPGDYDPQRPPESVLEPDARQRRLMAQRQRAADEVVGRKLERATLQLADGTVVQLAAVWRRAAHAALNDTMAIGKQSALTLRAHMARVDELMRSFDAQLRRADARLKEADRLALQGDRSAAQTARAQAEAALRDATRLKRQAYGIGERVYDKVRDAFWAQVRSDPRLLRHFENELGLHFRLGADGRPTGVPQYLEDGRPVKVSIEHDLRKFDDPRLVIDERNLTLAPLSENSRTLEAIRADTPGWR